MAKHKGKTKKIKDLPFKKERHEFGGGRKVGEYAVEELDNPDNLILCCRAGCGRLARFAWSACCDKNIQRPFCPECDVELNETVMKWLGDPAWAVKMTKYRHDVEEAIGRKLLDTGDHSLDVVW